MKDLANLSASAERIVDAAEGLIQTVGYNGFSYEDVARLVGIRKPSIHHHFATKADLGVTVAQRYTLRFLERLVAIRVHESTAAGRLKAYCQLFEDTYARERRLCICGMLGAESDGIPPPVSVEVRHFFEQNLLWLTKVLEEGAVAGDITLASPAAQLAHLFLSALEGSMLLGRARQSDLGPHCVAQVFLTSMLARASN